MKKISIFALSVLLAISMAACGTNNQEISQPDSSSESAGSAPSESPSPVIPEPTEAQDLVLSERVVKITSGDNTATFQLYDTVAAKELYDQLPLELELTNFRDAQWMFYPPQKLNVTDREAYNDGKKGELSYYAPWGDVFMLYKDFYAGDDMHRLGVGLTGIEQIEGMSGSITIEKDESPQVTTTAQAQPTAPAQSESPVQPAAQAQSEAPVQNEGEMQISVQSNGNTTVFELNDSPAAKALYAQLPLTIEVQDYSTDEKIFYPPEKLETFNTPLADAKLGTLAYYAPWGDVVMFYDSFGAASGLYELGYAISGSEHIENMSGTIQITK